MTHVTDEELGKIARQLADLFRRVREGTLDIEKVSVDLQYLIEGKLSVANIFSIICEGRSLASELVARGKYDWENDLITDERFPLQMHAPTSRMIELVSFNHDVTSEEVLAEFARRGLERPTYEDALYFGIEHPEEQRKCPVVFLHETVRGPYGSRGVLVLSGSVGGRDLRLGCGADGWIRCCVFAAVRK